MSRAPARVEWVRPPRQTRSQETLDRLLDAAEAIAAERGFENATVADIVQRANSSVGAMYARFNDKDALLGCLHDRFYEQAVATTDAALDVERWEGASVAEILSEAIPFLVGVYEEKGGLLRAFMVRSSVDRSFAETGSRLARYVSERLSVLLLARRDEIRHPDPVLAADFGMRMVFDTLDMSATFTEVDRLNVPLSPEALGQELTRMFLSYLGVEPIDAEQRTISE